VWVLGPRRFRTRILVWLDAFGMAAYAVVGALKAQSLGVPALSAVVMGVLTATFGGVIRDVLAHEPSVLLQRELYVTPALAGAPTFVGLGWWGGPAVGAGGAGTFVGFGGAGAPAGAGGLGGFAVALAIRAGAILWKWSLPGFGGPVD